jgi:hypothetical protein
MTEFVALTDNAGGASAVITSYVKDGGTKPAGVNGIAEGPGVTEVRADYFAFSAFAEFLFITDIFE